MPQKRKPRSRGCAGGEMESSEDDRKFARFARTVKGLHFAALANLCSTDCTGFRLAVILARHRRGARNRAASDDRRACIVTRGRRLIYRVLKLLLPLLLQPLLFDLRIELRTEEAATPPLIPDGFARDEALLVGAHKLLVLFRFAQINAEVGVDEDLGLFIALEPHIGEDEALFEHVLLVTRPGFGRGMRLGGVDRFRRRSDGAGTAHERRHAEITPIWFWSFSIDVPLGSMNSHFGSVVMPGAGGAKHTMPGPILITAGCSVAGSIGGATPLPESIGNAACCRMCLRFELC
jgi:hypothetical protein